jgi:hypothetical protein
VLVAALTHVGVGLPLAFLAPLWFFFAIVVSAPVLLPRSDERWNPQPFPVLPVFSPRPPPVR